MIILRRATPVIQPAGARGINWASPLAIGLVSYWIPGVGDLISGDIPVLSGASTLVTTKHGTALQSGGGGTSDYISLGSRSVLNLKTESTLFFLLESISTALNGRLLDKANSGGLNQAGFRYYFNTGASKVTLQYYSAGQRTIDIENIGFGGDSRAYVMVCRSNGVFTYVNGAAGPSLANTMDSGGNAFPLYVGNSAQQSARSKVNLGVLAIWHRALTDAEIAEISARPWQLVRRPTLYVVVPSAGGEEASGSAGITSAGTVAAAGMKSAFGVAAIDLSTPLTVAGYKGAAASPAITGVGVVVATGERIYLGEGEAALTGAGIVAVEGAKSTAGSVGVQAAGAIDADGNKIAIGTVAVAGAGTATATGYGMAGAAVHVSGTGSANAAGSKSTAGTAVVAGLGAATIVGRKESAGAAEIAGASVVTATGTVLETGAGDAVVSATASVTAIGVKQVQAAPSVSGTSTVSTTAFVSRTATAAIAAPGAVQVLGRTTRFVAVSVDATGTVTVTATLGALAQFVEVVELAGKWDADSALSGDWSVDVSLIGKAG